MGNHPRRRYPDRLERQGLIDAIGDGGATVAITGAPGAGKTRLAAEYVANRASDGSHEIVWWVRAATEDEVVAGLAELYSALGGIGWDGDPDAARQAIRWLEDARRRWLLVFDGAVAPSRLAPWLPSRGRGTTLVTSRESGWDALGASTVDVPLLPRDVAVEYLCARARRDDPVGAGRLADRLGGLIVALSPAALYVDETGVTFDEYVALIDRRSDDAAGGDVDRGSHAVAAVVQVAMERLRRTHPLASRAVEVAAQLASEGIPVSLFDRPEWIVFEGYADWDGFAAADRLGLIELDHDDPEDFAMHPMVQEAVRAYGGARTAFASAKALELLADEIGGALSIARVHAALRSHLISVEANAAPEQAVDVADLLSSLGQELLRAGFLDDARRVGERALAACRRSVSDDDPRTLRCLTTLAVTVTSQGDPVRASEMNERALRAYRRVLGEDHPDTLDCMHNSVVALARKGDVSGARAVYERAREVRGRRRCDEGGTATPSVSDLAAHSPADEREDLRRRLDQSRKALGNVHVETLRLKGALARLLREQGDLRGAEEMYRRALHGHRSAFGYRHPLTLTAMSRLVETLWVQGATSRARRAHRRVARTYRRTFGVGRPPLLGHDRLIAIFWADDDPAGARELHECVLANSRRFLGDGHPDTLLALVCLAATLERTGHEHDARALEAEAALWGARNPDAGPSGSVA